MGLAFLAHHEGIERAASGRSGVQHGDSDRVSTHREPADRIEVQVGGELQHYPTDQWSSLGFQGDATKVYVIVRLATRRQDHLAPDDRVDQSQQRSTVSLVIHSAHVRAQRDRNGLTALALMYKFGRANSVHKREMAGCSW